MIRNRAERRERREFWAPQVERGHVCCAVCDRPVRADEQWHLIERVASLRDAGPIHAQCRKGKGID